MTHSKALGATFNREVQREAESFDLVLSITVKPLRDHLVKFVLFLIIATFNAGGGKSSKEYL